MSFLWTLVFFAVLASIVIKSFAKKHPDLTSNAAKFAASSLLSRLRK